jgi:D-sedoheptulose 7-phosphate isomerase
MGKGAKQRIETAIKEHKQMVSRLESGDADTIVAAAELLTDAIRRGGTIYICGNGGSAADAQHIAGELVGRFGRERKALPAVALTTDTSVITSVSNDYGYDNAFARQVEALVREGDVLWALSTSGTSANVVAAVELAKKQGARILTFSGRQNSTLEQMSDICFCAHSSSTARSQEMHQLAYHIICELVERNFCKQ